MEKSHQLSDIWADLDEEGRNQREKDWKVDIASR